MSSIYIICDLRNNFNIIVYAKSKIKKILWKYINNALFSFFIIG